jgi:hypothetical protein
VKEIIEATFLPLSVKFILNSNTISKSIAMTFQSEPEDFCNIYHNYLIKWINSLQCHTLAWTLFVTVPTWEQLEAICMNLKDRRLGSASGTS